VIADTHVNQEEYESTSPFECNRMANGRTRYVIRQLNQVRPRFVIHLGDLVHPVPALPTYPQAARNFRQLTAELECPLYLVPGNHDVGDKPVAWAPAETVREEYLALWKEHFGADYYSFDASGLHFVVVNAQTINSGLVVEAEQRTWLERDLASHAAARTFLCLHYPPYVTDPEEDESYDNLGEPGRSWLLRLVETYRPEAVFCGHVHNPWYNRYASTDCYILPSTAFVRNDYSELYRVEPDDGEGGRNDLAKLGYFLVKVYERGHVCHLVRTYGRTIDPGQALPPAGERVVPLQAKENSRAPLGVDLRHPWAEIVEIPPMGAVDEFGRKRARNDYPLMALWECGIRKLRVPFQDFEDARIRERMRALRTLGHEFTVYTFDVPSGARRDLLVEHHDAVDAWEVICSWPEVERTLEAVAEVKRKAPLTVLLSKLRTKEDVRRAGSRYYHTIDHGFALTESKNIRALIATGDVPSLIDGVVYQVARDASPWTEVREIAAVASELGLRAAVYIRMASTNPAEVFRDDVRNANRLAEALAAAMTCHGRGRPVVDVFIDTFADIDRGYFIRNGLVDRRFNPRLGGRVVQNLYAALNESVEPLTAGGLSEVPSGRILTLGRPNELFALILPERGLSIDRIPVGSRDVGEGGVGRSINLDSGGITRVRWRRVGDGIELPGGIGCQIPTLMSFSRYGAAVQP
jgi:Icc-related predicted phosphoesterase